VVRYLLLICCAGLACAGTDPKPKAEDYDVHARVDGIEVGAEYMVHSFSGEDKTFLVDDYLVVEVALFPRKGESVMANSGEFTLRVDGKRPLSSVAPQGVVSSMQRRQWQQGRGVQAAGGVGDDVVVLGGPPRQTPPYGQEPRTTRRPPRAPDSENRSGLPAPEKVNPEELVVRTAFPEGTFSGPVSGFLFFPFSGKASKIKSVDLLYHDATLKLK
jgi:hypothetical protein